MHDGLFANQRELGDAALRKMAQAIGLDVGRFDACRKGSAADRVTRDAASAKALSVTGTPTFFIGIAESDGRVRVVRRLSGTAPPAQFGAAIDAVLSGVAAAPRPGTR